MLTVCQLGTWYILNEQKDKDPFCRADIVVYKSTLNFNIVLALLKFISKKKLMPQTDSSCIAMPNKQILHDINL